MPKFGRALKTINEAEKVSFMPALSLELLATMLSLVIPA